MTEDKLRVLVFDMLAALTFLRSTGRTDDIDVTELESRARDALEIMRVVEPPLKEFIEPPPVAPAMDVMVSTMPSHRECPKCSDTSPKTVHLRRPRGALQCRACGHEYNFTAAWV